MDTIFKQGDKVFDAMFGWGFVHEVGDLSGTPFPIRCHFNKFYTSYTCDGKIYSDATPTLSFTEYIFEGFSQERPEELPEKGQIVWGRDKDYQNWHIYHFSHKSDDGLYHLSSDNSRNAYILKQITTENPYENKES